MLKVRATEFFLQNSVSSAIQKAYTIQTHIIIIFSKPCQINDRDLVFKPEGLGESTATPPMRLAVDCQIHSAWGQFLAF